MEADELQPTIAETAKQCLSSFELCFQQSSSAHPRDISQIEDQFARLSLWNSNTGVFAAKRASMDHRLREAPDVQEAVIGLLETLHDHIETCSFVLASSSMTRPQAKTIVAGGSLHRALQEVANDINLLYKLLNAIRRASKEAHNVKAANSFKILNDEGEDIEELVRDLFLKNICDQFPNVSAPIQNRLAATMLLRRKRILYKRSRYGKTPMKLKESASKPSIKAPESQKNVKVGPEPTDPAMVSAPAALRPPTIVQSNAPSATTLAADKFRMPSTPSVVSASKTVAFANHQDLLFPPAPRSHVRQKYRRLKDKRLGDHLLSLDSLGKVNDVDIDEEAEVAWTKYQQTLQQDRVSRNAELLEVFCPFCMYALSPKEILDDKKWHSHVNSDLDAYVCLFEDCEQPEELYNHSENWFKHMREHALRWRCKSKVHGTLVFDSESQYEQHMREAHKGSFTETQIRVLAERNARTIGPLFESCPMCGVGPDDVSGALEDHIVGHMRSLALRSLPPYYEEVEGDSDGSNGSAESVSPRTRSTIEHDPMREIALVFDEREAPIIPEDDTTRIPFYWETIPQFRRLHDGPDMNDPIIRIFSEIQYGRPIHPLVSDSVPGERWRFHETELPNRDGVILTIPSEIDNSSLNLTPEEKHAYAFHFRRADPEASGLIMGKAAVDFFDPTTLSYDELGEIWQIADAENHGVLTVSGFCQALRLIAHCQAGKFPSRDLVSQPAPLPYFKGISVPPLPASDKDRNEEPVESSGDEVWSREGIRSASETQDGTWHWASKVLKDNEEGSNFTTIGTPPTCHGTDEPKATKLLLDDGFVKVLELQMENSSIWVRLHYRLHDNRARILLFDDEEVKSYCTPLTALKVLRNKSCLELYRMTRGRETLMLLWAQLRFYTYERMVLLFYTMVALKHQDTKPTSYDMEDSFQPGEVQEFGGEIEHDDYLHALRIFRDRDSGGVRLEATARRGSSKKVPFWIAFVTKYVGHKEWSKRLGTNILELQELHPHLFCEGYTPAQGISGNYELRFTTPQDADDFVNCFHSIPITSALEKSLRRANLKGLPSTRLPAADIQAEFSGYRNYDIASEDEKYHAISDDGSQFDPGYRNLREGDDRNSLSSRLSAYTTSPVEQETLDVEGNKRSEKQRLDQTEQDELANPLSSADVTEPAFTSPWFPEERLEDDERPLLEATNDEQISGFQDDQSAGRGRHQGRSSPSNERASRTNGSPDHSPISSVSELLSLHIRALHERPRPFSRSDAPTESEDEGVRMSGRKTSRGTSADRRRLSTDSMLTQPVTRRKSGNE